MNDQELKEHIDRILWSGMSKDRQPIEIMALIEQEQRYAIQEFIAWLNSNGQIHPYITFEELGEYLDQLTKEQ